MDPQAALEGARMAADRLAKLMDVDDPDTAEAFRVGEALTEIQEQADNLLMHFQALDAWLSNKGFLPEDWEERD